ncbi:hypothetical protein [Polaromonas sp. DSR2-3-2]|uniref:hypothetical protein n=1 Tax=unclassified Polaromonas TaxID=2638319 RepID=UPI003CED9FD8
MAATDKSSKRPKIKNPDGSIDSVAVAFYQEECIFDLGSLGALLFFAYSSLHSTYSYQHLKGWVDQLQGAIGTQKVRFRSPRLQGQKVLTPAHKLKIEKLHIPFWSKSSPFLSLPLMNVPGLNYRVLNAKVEGVSTTGVAWQGNIVFIYEEKTNTFAHHYLAVGARSDSILEQLVNLIDKTDIAICKKKCSEGYIKLKRSLQLPTNLAKDNNSLSEYDEVLNFFKNEKLVEAQNASGSFSASGGWGDALIKEKKPDLVAETLRAKWKTKIKFSDWDVHQYSDSNFAYQITNKTKSVPVDGALGLSPPAKQLRYIIDGNGDLADAIDRLLNGFIAASKKVQSKKEKENEVISNVPKKQEKQVIHNDWIDLSSFKSRYE